MRPFLFLLLLISDFSLAQSCTEAEFLALPAPVPNTPPGDAQTINCADLIIDQNMDISSKAGPITVNVTGNITISATITMNGGNGQNLTVNASGGSAGPGAGLGGGLNFSATQPGSDGPPSSGENPSDDLECGNGGSGAGMNAAGSAGALCNTTPQAQVFGGSAAYTARFDFVTAAGPPDFRGGYGGGAGGNGADAEIGSGGGGGGAIRILSTSGNITITSTGAILARGGNGGSATLSGGGGGGGSGGAIWLEATAGTISVQGTLDTRGGTGGTSPMGGNGGIGSNGLYRIQSSSGTTTGNGLFSVTGNNSSSTVNLNSNISCGSLKQEESNLFYQISFGFLLARIVTILIKTLFLIRKKFSTKTVVLN